jgi:hypothetical protein
MGGKMSSAYWRALSQKPERRAVQTRHSRNSKRLLISWPLTRNWQWRKKELDWQDGPDTREDEGTPINVPETLHSEVHCGRP